MMDMELRVITECTRVLLIIFKTHHANSRKEVRTHATWSDPNIYKSGLNPTLSSVQHSQIIKIAQRADF
jgi:hypothetical protein